MLFAVKMFCLLFRITDALNEAKDRLKFMTSLSRQFEEFYSSNSTPVSVCEGAIPSLMNALIQADSVSRFHARSGFLGLLLAKLTNQLITICKNYILELTKTKGEDSFWKILEQDLSNQSLESLGELISRVEDSKTKPRKRNTTDTDSSTTSICQRLQYCIQLYFSYRTQLSRMRDSINLPSNTGGGSVAGSLISSK